MDFSVCFNHTLILEIFTRFMSYCDSVQVCKSQSNPVEHMAVLHGLWEKGDKHNPHSAEGRERLKGKWMIFPHSGWAFVAGLGISSHIYLKSQSPHHNHKPILCLF